MKKGFTLLEMLVVIMVFSVLGILISRSIILTLRGSKKSQTTVRVRENLDYAMGVIERQIRNADSVDPCPNLSSDSLPYLDQLGNPATFSCTGVGGSDAYVASGSARLTSTDVTLTDCSFSCTMGASNGVTPVVNVFLAGKDANLGDTVENSTVTLSNQIYLRNY